MGLHSECLIRFSKEVDGEVHEHLVKTTIGRVIFNAPVLRTWVLWIVPIRRMSLYRRSALL